MKEGIKTGIAFFFAFLFKGITYSVGNFNFDNAPLFSLKFVYDCIVLLIYYFLALFIINKVFAKMKSKKN